MTRVSRRETPVVTLQLERRAQLGPCRGFVEAQCAWCGGRGLYRASRLLKPDGTPHPMCVVCRAGSVWEWRITAVRLICFDLKTKFTSWWAP